MDAIKAFEEEFKNLKVVDPACGSGAFLITVLRFLVDAVDVFAQDVTDHSVHIAFAGGDILRDLFANLLRSAPLVNQ
ncbi:hypothetical protein ACC758_38925, partial [Rhizobium ruizarguesonis]